MLKEV